MLLKQGSSIMDLSYVPQDVQLSKEKACAIYVLAQAHYLGGLNDSNFDAVGTSVMQAMVRSNQYHEASVEEVVSNQGRLVEMLDEKIGKDIEKRVADITSGKTRGNKVDNMWNLMRGAITDFRAVINSPNRFLKGELRTKFDFDYLDYHTVRRRRVRNHIPGKIRSRIEILLGKEVFMSTFKTVRSDMYHMFSYIESGFHKGKEIYLTRELSRTKVRPHINECFINRTIVICENIIKMCEFNEILMEVPNPSCRCINNDTMCERCARTMSDRLSRKWTPDVDRYLKRCFNSKNIAMFTHL